MPSKCLTPGCTSSRWNDKAYHCLDHLYQDNRVCARIRYFIMLTLQRHALPMEQWDTPSTWSPTDGVDEFYEFMMLRLDKVYEEQDHT